jgi:hypothetical protein
MRFHDEEAETVQSTGSLTLIVQAREEMAAGHYREAGRFALEAADAIETPEQAAAVAELAEEGMERCEFVQRGRFESVLELAEERQTELSSLSV